MTTPTFRSTLAQAMRDLVTFKRLEGFDYTAQGVLNSIRLRRIPAAEGSVRATPCR